jgi:hypothetical protein
LLQFIYVASEPTTVVVADNVVVAIVCAYFNTTMMGMKSTNENDNDNSKSVCRKLS